MATHTIDIFSDPDLTTPLMRAAVKIGGNKWIGSKGQVRVYINDWWTLAGWQFTRRASSGRIRDARRFVEGELDDEMSNAAAGEVSRAKVWVDDTGLHFPTIDGTGRYHMEACRAAIDAALAAAIEPTEPPMADPAIDEADAALAALDAAGIVASDQCMDCLGTADGLDSCITHAVIRELDQMHDSVRRYSAAIADPHKQVTWVHPGTSIVDAYRAAAGKLTPARLGADQAIANHYQLAVRWVYPLHGWTDDDLEIYESAVRNTPAPAMLDEDLPNAALDWRSADQIANTARERVRRLVIAANTRGISKYRIGQLLDGLVSEPTIAKWCAAERGTV